MRLTTAYAPTLAGPKALEPSGWLGLSPTLLQLASRRVGTASLVYAVAYGLDYGINRVARSPGAAVDGFPMTDVAAAIAIPVALLMCLVAWRQWFTPRRTCQLGLWFQVVASLGIALQENWEAWPTDDTIRGISWLCVWITFFPIIVPTRTRVSFLFAFLSASTVPAALFLTIGVRGFDLPSVPVLIDLFEPPYLVALLAPISAGILYQLGQALTRAEKLGSYELVNLLGRGGMGEVWRARHQMLARPAAIKLIRPDCLGQTERDVRATLDRFKLEVQATAALQSPHTIEVYDFGVSPDGTFYYVMELLNGLDLETLVRQYGPMPPARVIHVLRQVCESLTEAHGRGLVHRDIKPANIVLCQVGLESDFVKVLDFGLVKTIAPDGAEAPVEVGMTSAGRVAGTPAFLAPEQATDPRGVDHRADIYGLGCLGYWLLTGTLVFKAETSIQMIMRHVQDVPEPPSKRTELEIPRPLEQLILRCLQKTPGVRPQSAEEVLNTLDGFVSELGWSRDQAQSWWRRHRCAEAE